jgi:hypothetical protein
MNRIVRLSARGLISSSSSAKRFRDPLNQPPRPDRQIDGTLKKGGLISFDRMTNKLKKPSGNKKRYGPPPIEKEQCQRDRYQGNADRVAESVQRVLMFRFVVSDKRGVHYGAQSLS